jgi:hypothetical protein
MRYFNQRYELFTTNQNNVTVHQGFRLSSKLMEVGFQKESARIMTENKLVSISKKRFKASTSSKLSLSVCFNLLNQNFYSQAPN